jgi:hypothetical protein
MFIVRVICGLHRVGRHDRCAAMQAQGEDGCGSQQWLMSLVQELCRRAIHLAERGAVHL